jgi:TRAP-type C4-dicarboxylate transport system substrate-binding protein
VARRCLSRPGAGARRQVLVGALRPDQQQILTRLATELEVRLRAKVQRNDADALKRFEQRAGVTVYTAAEDDKRRWAETFRAARQRLRSTLSSEVVARVGGDRC